MTRTGQLTEAGPGYTLCAHAILHEFLLLTGDILDLPFLGELGLPQNHSQHPCSQGPSTAEPSLH